MPNSIYLDYNASAPISCEVIAAMTTAHQLYGNPSSLHALGREARDVIEEARDVIATFIGARSDQLIFTSGATESNVTVFRSVLDRAFYHKKPVHLIVSAIEHPSILSLMSVLESAYGVTVSVLPVDTLGRVRLDDVPALLTDDTALVSVMFANNEVGTCQPISEIASLVSTHDVLFHSDAVQALGKYPIDVDVLGIDFMSFSAHKVHGPKGVGALYVKEDDHLSPLFVGSQELGRRAGTQNIAGIVGFKTAVEQAQHAFDARCDHMRSIVAYLRQQLSSLPTPVIVYGDSELSLPNTLSVSFGTILGESLMMNLDLEGIAVSTGSACSTGSVDPSHVLLAMGLSSEEALRVIRLSIGPETTVSEIDRFMQVFTPIVSRLSVLCV